MDRRDLSRKIEDILSLKLPPIAVKVVKAKEETLAVSRPLQKSRYCQRKLQVEKCSARWAFS